MARKVASTYLLSTRKELIMAHFKNLLLITSATAALALTTFTGCESWRAHTTASNSDRSAGRVVDDKRITADIKADLRSEPTYKFSDVDVKTFDGVVQLSGFVSSDDQKQRAGQIAQGVQGVAQVQNNILLKPQATTPTGRDNRYAPTQPARH
jgi:osmotically-inducible protein OsmY